jgi:hypothetical protein
MSQDARHKTTTIIITQRLPVGIVVFAAKIITGPPNQHHRPRYYPLARPMHPAVPASGRLA